MIVLELVVQQQEWLKSEVVKSFIRKLFELAGSSSATGQRLKNEQKTKQKFSQKQNETKIHFPFLAPLLPRPLKDKFRLV